ncbi:MAG: hypothetical protein OES57_17145, partial [Acidimicrobiia bacterium]|nr:hypothetical protein [Acidimicrobiia bacterium]
ALFAAGIVAAVFRAYRVLPPERPLGLLVIGAVLIVGRSWDGMYLIVVVDLIIFCGLVLEHVRVEGLRASESTSSS